MNIVQTEEFRLSSGSWDHVESELEMYHQTKKDIMLKREEILYPHVPTDANVGGGRSNLPGDPTARKGTALEGDRTLKSLTQIVDVIDYVYSGLDDEKKELVKLMYWTKPKTLTRHGVAIKLNVTVRTVNRWRREIIYAIAALMGWR